MDPRQRGALQICLFDLIEDLNLESVPVHLCAVHVLSQDDLATINAETAPTKKRFKLLTILQSRDNSWNHFLDALKHHNQVFLVDKLQSALVSPASAVTLAHNINPTLEPIFISKLWEVPQRNDDFTGRDALLQRLITCFKPSDVTMLEQKPSSHTKQKPSQSNPIVISACNGLGGVGKTQLAIEFVHRYQQLYPYVFWFPAEESSLIEIAYQKLAQDLQLDTGNKPIDAIVRTIKAWFDRHNGCLLIYDNAPNYKTIQNYLPLTGTHILVTSRSTHWVGNSITVDIFTVEEARKYIQQLLGDQLEMERSGHPSQITGILAIGFITSGCIHEENTGDHCRVFITL